MKINDVRKMAKKMGINTYGVKKKTSFVLFNGQRITLRASQQRGSSPATRRNVHGETTVFDK